MSLRLFRKRATIKLAAFFVSLLAVGAAVADQNYVGQVGGNGGAAGSVVAGTGSVSFTGPTTSRSYAIADANATIVTATGGLITSGAAGYSAGPWQIPAGSSAGDATGYGGTNFANQGAFLPFVSVLTPDSGGLYVGTLSDTWHIAEYADRTFDFNNCHAGTVASTDPTLCLHSNVQNTTGWIDLRHDNSNGIITVGTGGVDIQSGTAGAPGWLRNKAGDLALNADYTNATVGFTNTTLITAANLISGRTYSWDAYLYFQDSTAADGAQFNFNAGAATVTNFRGHCFAKNNVGADIVLSNAATTTLATAVSATLTLTTQGMLECHGTFVPSSSSTFGIQAAQNAHTAGTLTIDRGSSLTVRDVNPL